jgi:hypothetical protein
MRDPPCILEVRKHKLVYVQKGRESSTQSAGPLPSSESNCMTPILQEVAGE